jgi:acyl-CoA reductase-like NAD-dependent aldehyde dehydrogenase
VQSPQRTPVIDPSTAEPFTTVPDCTATQLEAAVASASEAFTEWRRSADEQRRAALRTIAEALEANRDELARLISLEQGKPVAKGASEVDSALVWIRAYAEMGLPAEVVRDSDTSYAEIRRVPLGVAAAITAWNYPVLLAMWKIAPAIRTGNTVVVKPSPYTPVATLRVGELLSELLPAGVVNVISGGDEIGARLVEHRLVRKVSFTGSVATGRAIMRSAGAGLKRLTLELGGNDPGIVLPDADPAALAEELFWAAFSNCGQVCAGLKRLYVPEQLAPALCEALAEVGAGAVVGPGQDPRSEIGPVQNRPQLERVRRLVAGALQDGGDAFFVGDAPDGPGYFHPVTLVRGVREGTALVDEEQFGPVLPILTYRTVDEAVQRANATEFGLGASVWGSDPERAALVAGRLEAGGVFVGQHPGMGPDLPFGGVKQSGIGVESSTLGLSAYTDVQVLIVKRA